MSDTLDEAIDGLCAAQADLLLLLNDYRAPHALQESCTALLSDLTVSRSASRRQALPRFAAAEKKRRNSSIWSVDSADEDVLLTAGAEADRPALEPAALLEASGLRAPATPRGSVRGPDTSIDPDSVAFCGEQPESPTGSPSKPLPVPPPRRLQTCKLSLDLARLRMLNKTDAVPYSTDERRTFSEAARRLLPMPSAASYVTPAFAYDLAESGAAMPLCVCSESCWLSERFGIPGTRRAHVEPGWVRVAFGDSRGEQRLAKLAAAAGESAALEAVRLLCEWLGQEDLLLYDAGDTLGAAQIALALHSHFRGRIYVLDGGLDAWKRHYLPLSPLALDAAAAYSGAGEEPERPRARRRGGVPCTYVSSELSSLAPSIFVSSSWLMEKRRLQEQQLHLQDSQKKLQLKESQTQQLQLQESQTQQLQLQDSQTQQLQLQDSQTQQLQLQDSQTQQLQLQDPPAEGAVHVWDLRTPMEFSGAFLNQPAKRAGRIPWARLLPTDVFDAPADAAHAAEQGSSGSSARLRPVGELLAALCRHGIRADGGDGAAAPPAHVFYAQRKGAAARCVLALHSVGFPLEGLHCYDEGWTDWSQDLGLPAARWTATVPMRVGSKELFVPTVLSRLRRGKVPEGLDEERPMGRLELLYHARQGKPAEEAVALLKWKIDERDYTEVRVLLDRNQTGSIGVEFTDFGGFPVVLRVARGLPAAAAGIKEGDVVLADWDEILGIMQDPSMVEFWLARLD